MKKYRCTISLLFFFAIISLTGCTNSNIPLENKTIPESTTVSASTSEIKIVENTMPDKETKSTSLEEESNETLTERSELQGYLFESNGISIGMHEDAESVLAALGTVESCFETPSCAFLGMDRQYTYDGYMLTTYEENGREYIYDIYFLDEKVSTPEGIRIGSGIDEMIAAYGEEYTEDFGMYTYIKERSKLQFLIVDGVVTSVDYTALME